MLRMENSAYFVASCSKISSASGLFIRERLLQNPPKSPPAEHVIRERCDFLNPCGGVLQEPRDSIKFDREGKRQGSRKTISFSGNGVCEMIRPQNENMGYADRIHEEIEAAIAQEMRPFWNTPGRVHSLIGDNAVHSQTNASSKKPTSYFQLKLV